MEITIHRGTNEIGGTCIELRTARTSILLDLGSPLTPESRCIDAKLLKPDAVIISHPHQDHFGLIEEMGKDVPIYIGEVGKRLIDATRTFIGKELYSNTFVYIKKDHPFAVGDFTITPYLVDHSAVDAYSFLIEADGKRLFYSGDFRAHGRKSVLFDRMISNPPADIDLLFMEGTMMGRTNDDYPDEKAVEEKIVETLKNQENISFLICSSQNIDRIVSAFRACLQTGKIMVIDLYTAWVLETLKLISSNIPAMGWNQIRVYADYNYDNVLKEHSGYFENFRKNAYQHRIRHDELLSDPQKFLYLCKMSQHHKVTPYKGFPGKKVNVIYSQWLGYLKEDAAKRRAAPDFQQDDQVNFIYAHTSGHATVQDLKTFAGAIHPKRLVPIHTEFKSEYEKYFENVLILDDGSPYNF